MSGRGARGLRVDPIACRAHGLCAELLPEMIELDEWGYPIVSTRPVGPGLEPDARAAVAACPTLALRIATTST
jgi:ferredoxin